MFLTAEHGCEPERLRKGSGVYNLVCVYGRILHLGKTGQHTSDVGGGCWGLRLYPSLRACLERACGGCDMHEGRAGGLYRRYKILTVSCARTLMLIQ